MLLKESVQKVGMKSDKQNEFDSNFNEHNIHGEIDNEIYRFMQTMRGIYYHAADVEHDDMNWDFEKITKLRKNVESLLNLPDVYER